MSDEPSPAARELFLAVVDLPRGERGAFLDERCPDDDALRREVEHLLAHHDAPGAFMKAPAWRGSSPGAGPVVLPQIKEGSRIGRHVVTRVLGSGGMGTVYEAVQDHPHRRVALKVLRHGVASAQAVRRFQLEEEILGRLRHPNIAQIYEAGTIDEGLGAQPYFAMELVEGPSLVEHCRARDLSTRDRLEMFVTICDAVQHAHQKGVIHRDLKPDNVLVDDAGVPKILDFGVARTTESDIQITTLRTDVGQLIGTIPYMSPEQVTGDTRTLDTRSDVYALGVILYELISGRLPHDLANRSIPEAVRLIREVDPPPLSSIDRVFRGDVETIVAKALEKDPDRRYQTAAALAGDLRRYLAHEPIVARPPSTLYQLRKFARRNRALVGGLAGMFLLLVLGTVGTGLGLVRANDRSIEARAEAEKAEAVNQFLLQVLALANPGEDWLEDGMNTALADARGPVRTLDDLVEAAARELETAFPEWPGVRAELYHRLALTCWGRGRPEAMRSYLQHAYDLRLHALGPEHEDTLETLKWLAFALDENGRAPEAEATHRRVVAGLEMQFGPLDRRTLSARIWRANNLSSQGRLAEAEPLFRATIADAGGALGPGSRLTLTAVKQLMDTLFLMDRHADVDREAGEAVAIARESLPLDDLLTASLMYTHGSSLIRLEKHEEAARILEEALAWDERAGAGTTRASLLVAFDLEKALRALDRAGEAETMLRRKLAECEEGLGPKNEHTLMAYQLLARHLRRMDRSAEAETLLIEPREIALRARGEDEFWTVLLTQELGLARRDQGRLVEAEPLLRQVLESRCGANPDSSFARDARANLANLLVVLGQYDQAEDLRREQLEIWRRVAGPDQPVTLRAANRLAMFLKDREPPKLEEAEVLAREAIEMAQGAPWVDEELEAELTDTLEEVRRARSEVDGAVEAPPSR